MKLCPRPMQKLDGLILHGILWNFTTPAKTITQQITQQNLPAQSQL